MIEWSRDPVQIGPISWTGRIGKWPCFHISWRSMSKDTPDTEPRYTLRTTLPGLKSVLDHFSTPEMAQRRAQRIADYWFKEANHGLG